MQRIVGKFGGSSLANAERIKRVKEIIFNEDISYVVVSAPGKEKKEDIKITDLLITAFQNSKNHKNFMNEYKMLIDRVEQIKNNLGVNLDMKPHYNELMSDLMRHQDYDKVLSRGEFFNAMIIAKFLNFEFLDASHFIIFNDKGNVDLRKSQIKFSELTKENCKYVIPGFYGISEKGKITTFSRGGSDISGAIVAKLSKSQIYENFTDVDGFLECDPRIVKNPKTIRSISYKTLKTLSYIGCQVLHPDCIEYLVDDNIILNIRNTFNISNRGSFATSNNTSNKGNYVGIGGGKSYILLEIKKFNLLRDNILITQLLHYLENYECNVKLILSGINTLQILIHSPNLENLNNFIKENTKLLKQFDGFRIYRNIALIGVAGEDLSMENYKRLKNSFSRLNKKLYASVDIGSEGTTILLTKDEDFEFIVKHLYKELF